MGVKKFYYGQRVRLLFDMMEFLNIPKIIEKYGTFDSFDDSKDNIEAGRPYFFKDKKNPKIVDIYYDNVHIYLCTETDNDIVKVFLKKDDENWVLKTQSETENKAFQVYLWYWVKVLDDNMCGNSKYTEGNWNEYLFKKLSALWKYTDSLTIRSEFENEYGNKKKKK